MNPVEICGRLLAGLALSALTILPAAAQSPEAEALAKKYATEKAIWYEMSEHLRFKWEDGKLTARSTVSRELMPLSDAAAYNSGTVYHSYFHTLDGMEAHSLIPDGKGDYKTLRASEGKTTHATSESVFYDDSKQTTVTFPGLVAGSRTRLRYTLQHNDLHLLTPISFQSYLPIAKTTFSVTAPKGVKLRFTIRGNADGRIVRSEEEGKGGSTVYTFTALNMPKLQGYASAPSAMYYIPQVIVQLESYQAPDAAAPTPFLSSTADLYRYYYDFIRDVNNKPDDSVRALAAELTKGAATGRDKAARIYRWVQEHVRYVAFEDGMGGFVPREAAAVCARRYGDCKDMSSLLVSLCQAAGLDAHFTWIGTRHLPYTYGETPLPLVDNHMICGLKLDGQWIFLDGTDSDLPFGLAPAGLQGKEALIGLSPKDYLVIKVPEADAAQNTTVDSTHLRVAGGVVDGSVHIAYSGYPAWDLTGLMRYNNPTDLDRTFRALTTRGSNKYAQKSFDYKAAGPRQPFAIQSGFELKDYARVLDNELYVNLNLQRSYEDDAVDRAARSVPIEREYKDRVRQVTVLDIPAGYKVTYLPPAKEEKVPGLWSYRIRYESTPRQVRLIKEYEGQTLMIRPEQFADHNRMVESLRKQYKESVVLAKE